MLKVRASRDWDFGYFALPPLYMAGCRCITELLFSTNIAHVYIHGSLEEIWRSYTKSIYIYLSPEIKIPNLQPTPKIQNHYHESVLLGSVLRKLIRDAYKKRKERHFEYEISSLLLL